MTVWVGLTGGIGSGKSAAAAEFARLGVPVVDADAVSRRLTAPGGAALPLIRRQFGDGVFVDGVLDRARLRDWVFGDVLQKRALEAVMFPLILQQLREEMGCFAQAVYGIAEIPLLVENPAFQVLVQRIVVVDIPPALQIERVVKRNGLSPAQVKRIMAGQADSAARLGMADDVIDNSRSQAALARRVGQLHRFYSNLYAAAKPSCLRPSL